MDYRDRGRLEHSYSEATGMTMADEETFRALLIVMIAVCLPIGIYHRARAASREKLSRREEGLLVMVNLRLFGLAAWFALWAYLLNPRWMAWSSLPLPRWLRWVGGAIGVLVIPPLLFWVMHSLGRNLTDTVVTRREHALVTHGPYRWVRHPFYAVAILGVIASTLMTANGFLALTGAVAIALLVYRTRTEEAKLIERFGDEYRAYRERTGAFFPRRSR
jgi:protein-S-isoprenylcysteine O-methyltransferase Ste14